MPPMYEWLDNKTKKHVTVIRHYTEYDNAPTLIEARADGLTDKEFEDAEWSRSIGAATVIRAPGFGAKGHW